MALEKFDYFPKLPRELRDQIWEHCVRPYKRGAHFFTLFNSRYRGEMIAMTEKVLAVEKAKKMSLAAPRSCRTSKLSWFNNNHSAYLEGYGLWKACWESRMVMLRYYRVSTRTSSGIEYATQVPENLDHHNMFQDVVKGCCGSDGRRSYITFDPKEDLFCLQPFKFDTVDWKQTPFHFTSPLSSQGFQAQHVALEFDPSWIALFDDMNSYGFGGTATIERITQAATDKLIWAHRLWFIDYRIRRTASANYTDEGRYTFRGFRCKFVEVREYEDGWEEPKIRTGAIWDEDVYNFRRLGSELSIFKFLQLMKTSVRHYFDQMASWDSTIEGYEDSTDNRTSPIIGVLACELD